MNVFVIGATGFVGGALARHLIKSGNAVTGLARTDDAAATLHAQGITPIAGDLDARRPDAVAAALRADAVVYAAQPGPEQETGAVQDLTRALAGTGKALLFLSGSGVLLQRTGGACGAPTSSPSTTPSRPSPWPSTARPPRTRSWPPPVPECAPWSSAPA
ncbi:NAD dependent epimerase/dehydratase family protein [Streptomyces sp. yr375]|nr:NAD dependent epimerase/dehydratase family protein [Streptomyces sp. yr375]